jgi:thioredoxin 1
LQKSGLRIFSIFTLVFFLMSMSATAATASTGKVVDVTKLDQINAALKKGPVFLRIGASWCTHCKRFAPTLNQLAKEYAGKVTFMSIDIDKSPGLTKYFGTSVIPDCTVIVGMKNGKYVYMQSNGKTTTIRSNARITRDQSISVYRKVLNYAVKKK